MKKTGKWILSFVIAALVGLITFFLTKRVYAMLQKKEASQAVLPAHFDSRDTIQYAPVLGRVYDTASDMTVNAVLSGGFGPAVVMVYADWCRHCTDMMPAFEEAAAISSIQFVRIQGVAAPVTSQKHKVLGFPTILGIHENGTVIRFNEIRTPQKLLEFASSLAPSKSQVAQMAQVPQVAPAVTSTAPMVPVASIEPKEPEDTIVEIPEQVDIVSEMVPILPNVTTVTSITSTV